MFVRPVMSVQLSVEESFGAYTGRLWVIGDLKGAGDVGDSE